MGEKLPEKKTGTVSMAEVIALARAKPAFLEDVDVHGAYSTWIKQERERLAQEGEQHVDIRVGIAVAEFYRELQINDVANKRFSEVASEARDAGLTELAEELEKKAKG